MPEHARQHSLPWGPDLEPTEPTKRSTRQAEQADATARSAAAPTATAAAPVLVLDGRTVYVLDAHSLIYQVFHALPPMTTPQGEPIGAVYGFTRDLLQIIEQKAPDYLLCAFDRPGPTFRHDLYDRYKANRDEMPDELAVQLPKIRTLLEAFAVPILEADRYEADDILATVARICDEQRARCYLVTTDKDCRQSITDRVSLFNLRRDQIYDAASLAADWGIRPDQVVDFQALVGDPVDNIPGIPLIGPKGAGQLLQTYGTLEAVLEHAGEVKGAKRSRNLQEGREAALKSRRLVRLATDVPVPLDWSRGRLGGFDPERIDGLFAEYGFQSLVNQLQRLVPRPAGPAWRAEYEVVDTDEKFAQLLAQLEVQRRISIDTETTSVWPRWAEIVGISVCWQEGQAYYLPLRAPPGDRCLQAGPVLEQLRGVLEDPAVEKVGQNLKYDAIVLRAAGIRLAGLTFDTMVASYLLDAGQRNHNLGELAERYLNRRSVSIKELIGAGKQQKRMDQVPVEQVGPYAAEDADVPLRLAPILGRRLEVAELRRLFDTVEMPLVEVLAEMEYHGVKIDCQRLGQLSDQFGDRLQGLEREIYELAGRKLNIASPRQLAAVLFDELGLPVVKRTKTGPSTSADVLEQLAAQHPLPATILAYRQYAKLKNTYVDALPNLVHPETGRVHASFNQVVTATGRLSSSDPNLQNIPVRTDAGREIRSAFVPGRPGWKLLAADYSQIELRVLAHFSADEELCRAFAEGEDIHARVAGEVFGVSAGQVTAEMRRQAKAVNFGVLYGQSPFGLARALGIGRDEAARFIDNYFKRYPAVEHFLQRTLETCRRDGYVKTILGRQRAIQGVRQDAGRGLNPAERTAVNTVIQGSAADLIKLAMIAVRDRLREQRLDAMMVLQIHDELIFEVPPEELVRVARLVAEAMTGVLALRVPLAVDLKAGPNWADCAALEC